MLMKAKQLLCTGGYTCVLMDESNLFTSHLRGVRPLVQFIAYNEVPRGLWAADKVVGKATAYLYVMLGIREIYASVISRSAMELLNKHSIPVQYDTLVQHIINRTGNGICPFEEAVMNIDSKEEAYVAILAKMEDLGIWLDAKDAVYQKT